MTKSVFGIDFGTTNSLAAVVVGNLPIPLLDADKRPHPSVIWYRGSEVVVGREAYENMDITESGAPPGFVRSPKMTLRREGAIYVDGKPIHPTDAVAAVLKHLKDDAMQNRGVAKGYDLDQAVFTIPVDFGGPERRALREAAKTAGIAVIQFVHEPVAALYAYLRSKPNLGKELSRLEGRTVLVFDWGGGTLDLTLCQIRSGSIMQVSNIGDNDVGGDRFDERLRNLLRAKHAEQYKIENLIEQPGMAAKLLHQCEKIKIKLSDPDAEEEPFFIRNYLKSDDLSANLIGTVTREELDFESAPIVEQGLRRIDQILENAGLSYRDIELCLATGGMVNMPAIRNGLTERFVGRVPKLENGDRIIAEGAAWIAHDGIPLTLSKPIEILIATTNEGGTYYPLVSEGWELPKNKTLPVTNNRLYCTDPRDGVAFVEFAKPKKVGSKNPSDPRETLCIASVAVDPHARPLLERIECELQIDRDYIAKAILHSTARNDVRSFEFHNLDFGLCLPRDESEETSEQYGDHSKPLGKAGKLQKQAKTNVALRANITVDTGHGNGINDSYLWSRVPGDLVSLYHENYFAYPSEASELQSNERNFYLPCNRCKRLQSQIVAEGPIKECSINCRVPRTAEIIHGPNNGCKSKHDRLLS